MSRHRFAAVVCLALVSAAAGCTGGSGEDEPAAPSTEIVRDGLELIGVCGDALMDCSQLVDTYVDQDEASKAWVLNIVYREGADEIDIIPMPTIVCARSLDTGWPGWIEVESEDGETLANGAAGLTDKDCESNPGLFRARIDGCEDMCRGEDFPGPGDYPARLEELRKELR